ncbi:hypothetical protein F2Q69_00019316 [Brassica cretica]|uniref:Legume lectin domain-containing protein n=1 Tax=Brassica cretica TaxID=69181 RepID=A0A8S9QSF9_BRACR|nr:hypothetical protein F2Q69_00019316 [Brassica cretica]
MISSRRDESAPLSTTPSLSLALLVAFAFISQSSTPPSLWLSSTESVGAPLDDYSSLWFSLTPPRLALDRRRLRRPSLAVDASASRSRSSTAPPSFSSCRRLRISLSIVDGSALSTPPCLALDCRWLRRPSLAVDASTSRSRSSTALSSFSSCRRLRVSLSIVKPKASPKIGASERRESSHCKQRWHKINDQVGKFCGAFEAASRERTSGQNDNDVLKQAHEIFFNNHKKKFTLEHAWKELRNDQKWCDLSSSKTERVGKRRKLDDSAQSSTSHASESMTDRRPGVKSAKANDLSTPLREANLHLDASSPSSFSFSTEFVFVIFPLAKPPAYGQGMAFVVASKTDLMAKAATSGLGLFNPGNTNITENRILAVKHDTNESSEQFDESDNHVGIDINSIVSVASANATYFDATEGNNKTLLLAS